MIEGFFDEYRWLSNFHLAYITVNGKVWPSVEHYYQAMKSMDLEEQEAIRLAASPKIAKRKGMRVKLRPEWDAVKDEVMWEALQAKFTQNPELKDKLLATGDQHLVEGNWWGDTYWGVCNGKGENKLGEMLMMVRKLLTGRKLGDDNA